MMPWQHFGQTSSLCCEAAALNPDAPLDLCVLHVFASANGCAKSTLLPTSLDSRDQIRPFCTRHAVFERSRGQIKPFCHRGCKLILRSEVFALLCRCCPKTRRSARPLRPPRICCRNGVDTIDSFTYVIGFTCAYTAFLHTSCSFLNGHGGRSWVFAPVVEILCAETRLLPPPRLSEKSSRD
ncbi:unknown [Bacteroides sp. CAG:545]|nr:unknown [Bacteroides sp. CAG:545]